MQTPISPAQRDQLAAHLAALDNQLQEVSYHFNSTIEASSIMFAGLNGKGRQTKRLLTWSKTLPVPVVRLKEFLEHYSDDLTLERNNLVNIIEAGVVDYAGSYTVEKCDRCCRLTKHRNFYIVPGNEAMAVPAPANMWICTDCETVRINSRL